MRDDCNLDEGCGSENGDIWIDLRAFKGVIHKCKSMHARICENSKIKKGKSCLQ